MLSDEQYNRLLTCARESRADDYGLVIEGATLAIGEAAMRPGEVFGLHRPDIHWKQNMIHVRWQADLDRGKVTWPKDDDGRWVPMSPRLRAQFYELKHRAIQWMVDPIEDGGLGLDPAMVAEIVGHDDGGYLIATVYTKLGRGRALARAQRAMEDYEQRITPPKTPRRLHVVKSA
jgi:integrase